MWEIFYTYLSLEILHKSNSVSKGEALDIINTTLENFRKTDL